MPDDGIVGDMKDVLFDLSIVLAQAGGGGSFGGGGGGGGGGFSGGGGGFSGGGFSGGSGGGGNASPGMVVTIFIIIVVLNYVGKKGQQKRVVRTIRQGVKRQEQALQQQVLASIAGRDPGFDLGRFLDRAGTGFVTTQYAWSEQDLRSCRAFISDGVHERFELYIKMQKAEEIRNRMQNVSVVGRDVVAVNSDEHFDTIHVRFTARAISYNESLETGRRVSGNSASTPITFTEIWSFSRRPGVKTRTDASILEGTCPNCGSEIGIVDRAECRTCGSHINSGAYDWVLTEITQDEEWIVPSTRPVPGLQRLVQSDPGLNVQHLEDRASVVFWRAMMAVYFDDLSQAAPVLPAGATSLPQRFDPGNGNYWFTPAVGSVEVVGAQPAKSGQAVDSVKVLVRWSATRATGRRTSPRMVDTQRIYSDVLILQRQAGVTSNTAQTFTSFSCRQCGAPLDVGNATECQFCGTAINDGSTSWILVDIQPYDAMKGYLMEIANEDRVSSQRSAAQPSGAAAPVAAVGGVLASNRLENDRLANEPELMVALTMMAAADGQLAPKEIEHLTQMAQSRGVPVERIQQFLASGASHTHTITLPRDPEQAQAFMSQLIRGALIDGEISKEEQTLLAGVGRQMNWVDADLKRAIKQERKRLYQQSKEILRSAPPVMPEFIPPPLSADPDQN